ncbi:MAG: hypothetical protein JO313_00935 [Verrucomicrobia bacterium]|nr:hypothetical protein [Verrucomicrobiota bacterium]
MPSGPAGPVVPDQRGTVDPPPSVPSPKSLEFRCVQNGPAARREEGAYLNGYVTDKQRSHRPIFNATLWAVSSWLFFRVARSLHIDLDMLVARALKNSQLAYGET